MFLVVLPILLAGCAAKHDVTFEGANTAPAQSTVERGPVRLTVEISPAKARLSDEPTLTLTIDHAEGVNVQKPPFGDTFCGFLIRDFREPLPKVRDGREIIQQVYTLEPTRAGKMTIDPIGVTFTDLRPGGDGKTHTLETESISVEVTSVVGEKTPSLGDLHGAAAPVGLQAPARIWIWVIPGAIAAALAVGWWWLHRRRRSEVVVAAKILSPEELANLELDKLVESGLAGSDVKLFYVELTGIVRRYIERTTGIRAPEQTTEEFLREISRAQTFERDDGSRLRDFLEAADLVKFAAHRPRAEDVDESVRRARLFIGISRQRAVQDEEPAEVAS